MLLEQALKNKTLNHVYFSVNSNVKRITESKLYFLWVSHIQGTQLPQ